MNDYAEHDGLGLAALVRAHRVSPAELVDAAIARIETHNPKLNAVVVRQFEQARAKAAKPDALPDGPFRGVPFLIKDLFQPQAGVPMTNGSRYFKDFVAPMGSAMTDRIDRSGVVVCGRTNSPEGGLNAVTEPVLHGPTRNPWNTDHTPGGSSGGSSAAVASGMVPVASASDGGGSIRIPASCCGLFGLKPTRHRVSAGPGGGDPWNGLACMGVVSRSVRDSAAMLDAMSGAEAGDPYGAPHQERPFLAEVGAPPGKLRIAFTAKPMYDHPIHADCIAALHDAATLCEGLGHAVEEAAPDYDRAAMADAWATIVAANEAADLVQLPGLVGRPPGENDLEPWTWAAMRLGQSKSAADVLVALRTMHWESRRIAWFFQRYDVLLTPTLGKPPVRIGELATNVSDAQVFLDRLTSFIPYTPLANCTGEPSMSVPLSWNAASLPIGAMFTARYGEEATLFRLAGQLERARPWTGRRPPIW